MEIETLKTKSPFLKGNRLLNTSLLSFDLPALIDMMKHSHTYAEGELNAMILLKRPDKQIVLTALHEGTEIISFQSNDSITFQIIEGELGFHTQKESVNLEKSQLLTFHEKVKYRLTAREETMFLLTIANRSLHPAEN